MHNQCFAAVFALGLFTPFNVFAQEAQEPQEPQEPQGAASQPFHKAESITLFGAPLPAPPSAQFPPAPLRPFSVGQLNMPPSGYFQVAPVLGPKTPTRWYGWQTILWVGGSDLITLVGGLSTFANPLIGVPLIAVGIGGHVMSGPIVHWSHGHVGKGFVSLGVNLGAPLVGALVGAAIDFASSDSKGPTVYLATISFASIGYFVGPIIDIAALSTEEVTPGTQKGSRQLLPSSMGIVPMIDSNRRGLSIMGRF